MQLGNRFCYETAIARVVTYLVLRRAPIAYIDFHGGVNLYDFSLQRSSFISTYIPKRFSGMTLAHSRLDLYVYFCKVSRNQAIEHCWIQFPNIHCKDVVPITKAVPNFTPRQFSSLADFKGRLIFISGGRSDFDDPGKPEVFQYRISTNSWTSCPNLNQGRVRHSSCVVENSVFVCGGYLTRERSNSCKRSVKRRARDDTDYAKG